MPHTSPSIRYVPIVAAMIAAALATAGCNREKPNATRDIQRNQSDLMDNMDKIAAQLEAEEKAKQQKSDTPSGESPTTPPARPAEEVPPSDKHAPAPAETAPGDTD